MDHLAEKLGTSHPIKRTEDQRFLIRQGQYMDDDVLDNVRFALLFCNPVVPATITALGLEDSRAVDESVSGHGVG
ncbi:hypothetical protein SAMN05444358_10163 [Ruegeria halocynthiae]|uniref:Uncharacterized protein n=1 Tax=Ruegeria halocynthiae TaxID=985054 RepID=A0A1H2R6Z0_9RHOB|nr:hypothetical protein [Ruegeria halocynthiae]SDW15236.1 hypothetical protein SAMN05444358_10163 [Ruegeria halocynthiae]